MPNTEHIGLKMVLDYISLFNEVSCCKPLYISCPPFLMWND